MALTAFTVALWSVATLLAIQRADVSPLGLAIVLQFVLALFLSE